VTARPGAGSAGAPEVAGLVLAAGAGRRLGGRPKALLAGDDGEPLLRTTVRRLRAAGCAEVVVVLGAAPEAASVLGDEARAVVAEDWAEGMGASMRRGLAALQQDGAAGGDRHDRPSSTRRPRPAAALVTLADLPDVGVGVMRRVVTAWRAAGAAPDALVRATFDAAPGHPVLIGRAHWAPLARTLAGDVGAQPYLRARRVLEVDCDDLATGRDLDRPEDLDAWTRP
jgi:CTP:molybdopterin cytidylyltransferase MocA